MEYHVPWLMDDFKLIEVPLISLHRLITSNSSPVEYECNSYFPFFFKFFFSLSLSFFSLSRMFPFLVYSYCSSFRIFVQIFNTIFTFHLSGTPWILKFWKNGYNRNHRFHHDVNKIKSWHQESFPVLFVHIACVISQEASIYKSWYSPNCDPTTSINHSEIFSPRLSEFSNS